MDIASTDSIPVQIPTCDFCDFFGAFIGVFSKCIDYDALFVCKLPEFFFVVQSVDCLHGHRFNSKPKPLC